MKLDVSKLAPVALKVLPYVKAVVATGGALVTTLVCFSDGTITDTEATVIGTAWATAWGVWRFPNKR